VKAIISGPDLAEDAVAMLNQVKLKGYVFPSGNGWVTFLAEKGDFKLNKKIASAARQPLMHYVNAEDHGWEFTLINNGIVECRYGCDWNDRIKIDDKAYSRDNLVRLIPGLSRSLLLEFEKTMHPTRREHLFDGGSARLFAQAMNLEHYDWLSFDYVDGDFSR